MSDRRRNLAVLLFVGLLLVGAAVVIALRPTKQGLDLKGGVELVYQAKPTAQQKKVSGEAITRAIDIMRKRVDALGVAEPELQRSGSDQITVSLPDVKDAPTAARQVGTTAQLFFFDWEKNVVQKNGKTDPLEASKSPDPGGVAGGCFSEFDAVARARRRPAQGNPATQSEPGTKYYLVNNSKRTVIAGPEASQRDLTQSAQDKVGNSEGTPVTVNAGTVVVQASAPDGAKGAAAHPDCYYVLNDQFALRGTQIKNPEQNYENGNGSPNVTFDFTSSGKKQWQKTTREIAQRGQDTVGLASNPNQHFAILLDQQLVTVPYIDYKKNPDGIDGSTGSEISGGFTIKSAQDLANELKYGALPVKLDLVSQNQVSATLGKQALDKGLLAATIGFVLTAFFLLAFYRVLGLLAVGALLLYGVYLFALVKGIPVVLTLPGIAGLVLTIGVCADANIVVFERIKEEISHGRSVRAAIGQGYKRGLSTIVDANVVTFMTAFVLFMLSTADVRGFALMLGLGVLVTLFSAILATQALLGATGAPGLRNAGSVGARTHGRKRQIDFNGATKYLFTLSGIILLAGAFALATKGLDFGIDFKSGTRVQIAFSKNVDENAVRSQLSKDGLASAQVQKLSGSKLGANTFQISTGQLAPAKVNDVTSDLNQAFGARGQPETQAIGPTFGKTIARSAAIAVVASLLLIAVYIALRFEWKYAGTTAISLAHDLLITAGLYALTGREVNSSTVAALLTVLGFSLYDTIIVSDRIRENTPRMPSATFSQISNRSMNEVIVRSLSTVTCACLPILALFLFGGSTLQDFAFALLVGTISGAYSSIFISSPVLTEWKEREEGYRRRRRAQIERYGEVPAFAPEGSVVSRDERKREAKRRLTAPDDPNAGVSQAEFNRMVTDLDVESETDRPRASRPTQTQVAPRRPEPEPQDGDGARDLTPDELFMKDDKKKRPRNKRHGRPR